MKFKIINSDQGHNYTHYVEAPDKQTAMERFKAGHYGSIIYCEELTPISKPLEQEDAWQKDLNAWGKNIENVNKMLATKVEDIKESKELALKIASGIYLKFHEKHNLSLADCEEMADFVLEHF